jgi:hypothetical protein
VYVAVGRLVAILLVLAAEKACSQTVTKVDWWIFRIDCRNMVSETALCSFTLLAV